MKQTLTILCTVACFVGLTSSSAFAQSPVATGKAPATTISAPLGGCAPTAYDQTASQHTFGTASQFFPDFAGRAEASDNFVVPPGVAWDLCEVFIAGFLNAAGVPPPNYDINIRADAGGVPGAIVCSSLAAVPISGAATGAVLLPMSPVCILNPGEYWIDAVGNLAFNGGQQWFWFNNTATAFAPFPAKWRDTDGLFGSATCPPPLWRDREAVCGIGDPAVVDPDQSFTLFANVIPLPVELVDFTVFVEQNEVTLNWQTATETDNSGFEVQVKQGDTFQTLAFVDGYGTTLEAQNYSYRVTDLDPGTHTFRLKQIDFDGQFEYSPEVQATVEVVDHYFLTEAYPNPFNPSATIRFAVDESQPVVMALYNMHGQRVRTVYQGVPAADEMQTVHINAGGLPSGMYMVQLVGNTFRASQSVTLLK